MGHSFETPATTRKMNAFVLHSRDIRPSKYDGIQAENAWGLLEKDDEASDMNRYEEKTAIA